MNSTVHSTSGVEHLEIEDGRIYISDDENFPIESLLEITADEEGHLFTVTYKE